MPGLESKGAPALEGEYSDWTIYDSFTDGDAVDADLSGEAIVNRAENKILIFDISNAIIKAYDIATKVLSASLVSSEIWGDVSAFARGWGVKSAYGTYSVDTDRNNVYIFKDGSLIKTLSASDLGITANRVRCVSVSPKGKYIVVLGYLTTPDAMGWVVLVGS